MGMPSPPPALTVLRSLRPLTHVRTPSGEALVLCQLREHVTVLERGTVRVYERWECEAAQDDGWTAEEREWFRRPVTEVRS